MFRAIVYDLPRLFLGPLSLSSRGIDRVDVALASHFFPDDNCGNVGILPTPWGIRCFKAGMVRRGLDHLHHIWAEKIDEDNDPRWRDLVAALCSKAAGPVVTARRTHLSAMGKARRMGAHLRRAGVALGQPVTALPHGAIYLTIGQIGLAVPAFHGWLSQRPDITAAFMLHDTIPLEYPQFVAPSAVQHHARMVRTAVEQADLVITTTWHARSSILEAMARMGRPDVPMLVRGQPLPHALGQPRSADPALAGQHYFLTCSTVQPRKNHGLLIDGWRRLIARLGDRAPQLVIVGSAGRNAGAILGEIAEDAALARHIHHISGLSCTALGWLTLGAAAMLCPSFGLSVLEGNALGVPTIASDIADHREIADAATVLMPADDSDARESAILTHGAARMRSTPPIPDSLGEPAYCQDIATFLQHFAQGRTAGMPAPASAHGLCEMDKTR